MECAFEERILSHLHLSADEWLRQEETADMIVPDSSPDAEQILDSYAVCTVRSVECRTGSVLISGGVQAGVIYLAQEETAPRVLESYLPFSIKKDLSFHHTARIFQQIHDRFGRHTFSAAGLSDNSHNFSFRHLDRDIVHRRHHTFSREKAGLQMIHFQ